MKKNILSILAAVIALGAMIFTAAAFARLNARLEALETYTASLIMQVQQLSGRNDSFFSTSGDAVCGSLLVDSWNYAENTLTVTGFAEVQLAQPADSAPESSLVLILNGLIHKTQPLALTADESGVCFEAELQDIAFSLPELTGSETLALWVDVNIGGEIHSIPGVEWYPENGELLLVAG